MHSFIPHVLFASGKDVPGHSVAQVTPSERYTAQQVGMSGSANSNGEKHIGREHPVMFLQAESKGSISFYHLYGATRTEDNSR